MVEMVEFELVSPERLLLSERAEMVVIPGVEGDFGVLPQHAPLLSTIRPGVIDVYNKGNITERIFVAGGFAEVTETTCTVLAEEAIPLDALTRSMAEQRLSAAKAALDEAETPLARAEAETSIAVAEAMLVASAI
ncbi:MAG: F0F1 ATP synthase subunit epsilon [Alphaproteobacteria bacterium]|nr:F0F1 ATP synthase subunit epsilon [Alphaproteobacteria bacterium]